MDIINALTTASRLPARIAFAFWLALSVAIFGPEWLKLGIGIEQLVEDQRGYFGAAWLVLLLLSLTQFVGWIQDNRKQKARAGKAAKRAHEALRTLDPSEMAVLREFYIQGQNTLQLPFDHPVVAGMINKKLLVQAGAIVQGSMAGMLASLAINEVITDSITYELIGLPEGEPSGAEIERIRNTRPEFSKVLEDRRRLYYGSY